MLLLLTLLLQEDAVAAIAAYKTSGGDHWLPPAAIAAEALEAGKWRLGYRSASEFLASAAERAGYQVNSFRRQVRSAGFLKERLGEGFGATVQSAKAAVSAVEMLARLHAINPEKAAQLLHPVLDGQRGFVEVREVYEQESRRGLPLRNSLRASVKVRDAEFQTAAKSSVLANLDALFPPEEVTSVGLRELPHLLPLARLDFVLVGRDAAGKVFAEAVDCKNIGIDNTRSTVIPLLQQSSLLALQFRRVWMAFPTKALQLATTAKAIDEFTLALQELGLDSVGVLLLTDAQEPGAPSRGPVIVKRRPVARPQSSAGQRLALATLQA